MKITDSLLSQKRRPLHRGGAFNIPRGCLQKRDPGEVMQAGDRGCAAACPGGGYPGETYGGGIRCVMEIRVLQIYGGSKRWGGRRAGHTSEGWHGTGTAKRERCAGSADSRSTTRSRRQALTRLGNLITCSLFTCVLISSLTLITSKHRTGRATDLAVMEPMAITALDNSRGSGDRGG